MNSRAGRRWLGLIFFIISVAPSAAPVTAGSDEVSAEPAGEAFEVRLRHRSEGFEYSSWLPDLEVEFSAEPAYAGENVVRGGIPVGPGPGDVVGYAIDMNARRLYVDLNRNGDLTDDPEGIFEGLDQGWRITFNPELTIEHDGFRFPVRFELWIHHFRGSTLQGIAALSGWRGEFEIDGRRWEADFGFPIPHREPDYQFRIKQAGDEQAVPRQNRPMPARLLIHDRYYEVSSRFVAGDGDPPDLILDLQPVDAPMGTLRIEGDMLEWVVLQQDGGLAIRIDPAGEFDLPVGSWRVMEAMILAGDARYALRSQPHAKITDSEPVVLQLGAPLNNTVSVRGRRSALNIQYKLIDAGGHAWRSESPDRSAVPGIEIWLDDTRLVQADFRYG